jgi:hypothetical protein
MYEMMHDVSTMYTTTSTQSVQRPQFVEMTMISTLACRVILLIRWILIYPNYFLKSQVPILPHLRFDHE